MIYYYNNKEEIQEYNKNYWSENKEKIAEKRKRKHYNKQRVNNSNTTITNNITLYFN